MQPSSVIPHYQLYGQPQKNQTSLSFHIQTIEAFNRKYGHYHHPHRHPDLYQMVWVTGGSGVHTMDMATYKMQPNCLYTLSPGIVHTCRSSQDLKGYILHFSADFMLQYAGKQENPIFHFGQARPSDSQLITHIYQQILTEFIQVRKGREQVIQSLIMMLLVYKNRLISFKESNTTIDSSQIVNQQFQRLVNEKYASEKRLSFYAKALNISTAHLKENIKNTTGINASEIIQKRVILEAKRQLIYSQLTISEIAFLLGFADPNYFFKYFRRLVGQSPGEFRKEHVYKLEPL